MARTIRRDTKARRLASKVRRVQRTARLSKTGNWQTAVAARHSMQPGEGVSA